MRIETPISRATDPESSHVAGETLTKSGARQKQIVTIHEWVIRYPGSTSQELAMASGIPVHTIGRRCPDAETAKLIARGQMRVCRVTKKKVLTWWPVEDERVKDEVDMWADTVMAGPSLEDRRNLLETVPFHLREKVKARVQQRWKNRRKKK